MKTTKSAVVASLVLLACCRISAVAMPEDDRQAIEAIFANTNSSPDELIEAVRPYYTNVWWNLARTNPTLAREYYFTLATNVFNFHANDVKYWTRWGLWSMFDVKLYVFSTECASDDLEYLNYCADELGDMRPIPEQGDHPRRQWVYYNGSITSKKNALLRTYKDLVTRYEKLLPDADKPAFRSNIVERARLTEKQRKTLWPEE